MSARPRQPAPGFLRAPRRLVLALAVGAVAALGLGLSAPADSAFAVDVDHGSRHAPTRLERALEHGTLESEIEAGRITQADFLEAGEVGMTVHGRHIDGWTDPTSAQEAQGERIAARLRADPAAASAAHDAMSELGGLDAVGAPTGSVPSGAAGITESKHWWNKAAAWLKGSHVYINGPWFKTIVAGGVSAGMIGLCLFFDFSKITCSLVGAAVATVAEWIKNTSCARGGIWLYYPYYWRSHC